MADDDLRVNEILDRSEQNPSSLSPQEIFYLEVTTNHAKEHFLKSGHLYAINMDNKNVWNFSKVSSSSYFRLAMYTDLYRRRWISSLR